VPLVYPEPSHLPNAEAAECRCSAVRGARRHRALAFWYELNWARGLARALGDTLGSAIMQPSPIRIEPIPGYSPTIGRLIGMLTYARSTTLVAVEGLTLVQLDHLYDANSNSIGALLAHMAAVERSYQVLTFEERLLSPQENERWSAALKLGANGRDSLRGYPLESYLEDLASVRRDTLEALATRDDAWLERSLGPAPKLNAHWVWFHVAEDEINHRGQIRWLRARLPKGEINDRVT
jgi:uncharacterized damage-inducible protein DinB